MRKYFILFSNLYISRISVDSLSVSEDNSKGDRNIFKTLFYRAQGNARIPEVLSQYENQYSLANSCSHLMLNEARRHWIHLFRFRQYHGKVYFLSVDCAIWLPSVFNIRSHRLQCNRYFCPSARYCTEWTVSLPLLLMLSYKSGTYRKKMLPRIQGKWRCYRTSRSFFSRHFQLGNPRLYLFFHWIKIVYIHNPLLLYSSSFVSVTYCTR